MKKLRLTLSLILVCLAAIVSAQQKKIATPVIGADISWLPEHEAKGMKFSSGGVEGDAIDILKAHKFNWIRLRIFVDPAAENGYSKQGFCDTEHTLAMAKRVKAAGMNLLLDFHYSDTWADPGKQFKPSSWAGMRGDTLCRALYDYTVETLAEFRAAGVAPDMVQVGNEINHGMVWPDGKTEGDWSQFCALLVAGCKAVRDTDPGIAIMVHIACGGQNKESVTFFDRIIAAGTDFDIIGQSYYPEWHGTLDDLKNNLTDIAARYKKPLIVVEYNEVREEVNDIANTVPGGLGSFIWEATSPRWGGLFDKDGKATQYLEIYPRVYEKYSK